MSSPRATLRRKKFRRPKATLDQWQQLFPEQRRYRTGPLAKQLLTMGITIPIEIIIAAPKPTLCKSNNSTSSKATLHQSQLSMLQKYNTVPKIFIAVPKGHCTEGNCKCRTTNNTAPKAIITAVPKATLDP